MVPVLEKYETALLMVLGFGGISLILAILHRTMRKYIFHDQHNVDTAFDAGGRVSTSLTAVTVASQFLWPGDLLQSSTITVKVRKLPFLVIHNKNCLLSHLTMYFNGMYCKQYVPTNGIPSAQFRKILWNQTTYVHRGSTLITRVLT